MGDRLPMMEFNKGKLARLEAAYRAAREQDQAEFTFDGHAFVVSYARYLIEYLKTKLSNGG